MRDWTVIRKRAFPNRFGPSAPRIPGSQASAEAGKSPLVRTRAPALRAVPPRRTPSEGTERYSPRPLIGRRRGGVASGAWFCAPEPARRSASRARSERHGEEWLRVAGEAEAMVWAWVLAGARASPGSEARRTRGPR